MLRRVLRQYQDALCTYVLSKRWFDKSVQIGPEKSAPECPFECGEGGTIAIWAMPKYWRVNFYGTISEHFLLFFEYVVVIGDEYRSILYISIGQCSQFLATHSLTHYRI